MPQINVSEDDEILGHQLASVTTKIDVSLIHYMKTVIGHRRETLGAFTKANLLGSSESEITRIRVFFFFFFKSGYQENPPFPWNSKSCISLTLVLWAVRHKCKATTVGFWSGGKGYVLWGCLTGKHGMTSTVTGSRGGLRWLGYSCRGLTQNRPTAFHMVLFMNKVKPKKEKMQSQ